MVSNCGTATEKVSKFLDNELKLVRQQGWSYIKGSGVFIKKLKNIDHIPQDAIMGTADVVGLYPNLTCDPGLEVLKKALDNRKKKNISTDNFTKMAEFVSKNIYFEFDGKVKKQISGSAISTKFSPSYACRFMDQVDVYEFLET